MNLPEQYREHGYVVLPQALPDDLIDEHVIMMDALYEEFGLRSKADLLRQTGEVAFRNRFGQAMAAVHARPDGLRLALWPKLRNTVIDLLGEDVILSSASTVQWGSEARAHSDTIVMFRGPPERVCRAWVALEDLDPDSGLLYMMPGTHRSIRPTLCDEVLGAHPEFKAILHDLAAGGYDEASFGNKVKPIAEAALHAIADKVADAPQVPMALRKGDAVVFNLGTIHGALPRINLALTRKAMILEWHGRSARSFSLAAYFGSEYDHRRDENVLPPDPILSSPWGDYAVPDPSLREARYRQRMVLA